MANQMKWTTIAENKPDGEWSHAGISVLRDGRIVYADLGGASLVFTGLEKKSESKVLIGTSDAHGIFVNGDQIWVADIGPGMDEGQVLQLNEVGELQQIVPPPECYLGLAGPWKPTSIALVSGTGLHNGDLWIADGYGQSLVHRINNKGEPLTLSGEESGINFDCPHGIVVDTRSEPSTICVADRGNKRLVFFDLDGNYLRSVTDSKMTSPSSIAVWGNQLVITDLFGSILRMDIEDKVEYLVETVSAQERPGWPNQILNAKLVAPEMIDGLPNSPHGIAVDKDERIFFTEWLIGGRVVMLSGQEY